MDSIPRLGADATVDEIEAHLTSAGCVIVERLNNDALLAQIDAELEPALNDVDTNNTVFSGLKTKRFNGILSAVKSTQTLAVHPLILATVERMLSPLCAKFQLNYDGIMHLLPGESHQELHRDGGIYPMRHPSPPATIACMWAQTDFTVENGGTCLVPGSHQWAHEHEPDRAAALNATMPRGSVLLYTGGVFHGAGENRSNGPRTGISLQYSLGWLRQELNMYLTYPPEVAKSFPDQLQRLIGYELAGRYLGFINEGNPHLVLEDGDTPDIRERTTDELEAAAARIEPIPFGVSR